MLNRQVVASINSYERCLHCGAYLVFLKNEHFLYFPTSSLSRSYLKGKNQKHPIKVVYSFKCP
ncbi:MAG: hypothetical protein HEEMFOPI_00087 [Holosporales bacterium]